MRHPQYDGLLLVMMGSSCSGRPSRFLIRVGVYLRLANSEERGAMHRHRYDDRSRATREYGR
ncbi:hypothetical protein [Nocardia asiatica]|uniref:hypothetical protein n=1 Tax=Nocardia asiatica TaxID=209252 RepID=UPI0024550C48|nr:hypothetical protein [Nocardia asiatica]